ncbi:MAG TPA: prepilin peptidase [Longimicrobiales bacterium]
MTGSLVLYAGLIGLAIGSFLNVCIFRLPAGLSVVSPRSRCPRCERPIPWHENIPVLSYVLLRGRCRGCSQRISLQYPLVELATGAIWAAMAARYGPSLAGLSSAVFLTLLLGIALTDAREYIIPNEFSVGGLLLGLGFAAVPGGMPFPRAALGAALGFGCLYLVAVVGKWAFRKEAMGGGDIKMMAMVGAFLGPAGAILTIFLGALLGTLIFGPIALVTRRLVPFGIFLALGAAVAHGWGDELLRWYLGFAFGGG